MRNLLVSMHHGGRAHVTLDSTILSDPNRLDALRIATLADEDASAAFDRLTRLAARVMAAPTALITAVDTKRMLIKSQFGLPHPFEVLTVVPVSRSLCRYPIEN